MVKFNPDMQRIKQLEELQKQKQEKESELKEEEAKQKELEKSQKEKQEEIEEVEKKLEAAVETILTEEEEQVPVIEQPEIIPEPEISLEESVQNEQRELKEGEGGSIYEINRSDLENIGNLYQQVVSGEEDAIKKAQDMLYHLNKKEDAYITDEARELADRDAEGKQYVGRLRSIMEGFDEQSDRSFYKG